MGGARVASPVLVGRAAELAALESALASGGAVTAVLVDGEAGAGKTRLVAEFAARAGAASRLVTGSCVALGAEALPYASFMGALGQLTASLGPEAMAELAGSGRSELARLVPDLRRPDDDARALGAADRAALFQVVLRTLEAAAAADPLVVVLEDLHWADSSSRELLGFLVERLRAPVLVVATYRGDEIHKRHPLRTLLAVAARSARVRRITLAPLTPAEVADLLAHIAGAELPQDVVDSVVNMAEGNPFFAEELLAAGGGAGLPPDLAEVLSARVAALPQAAQDVVGLAAVAGTRVSHDLLAAAAARAGLEFDAGLREACSHNVLVADDRGGYVLRHSLLREAAYAELLPGDRARLHAAYAGALADHAESATAPGVAGELAHHYLAAHEPARALAASMEAADAAVGTYAFSEAHGLYEQALALCSQVPRGSELPEEEHAGLLRKAAEAASLAGETERAIELVRLALSRVNAENEPARAAMLHERLARFLSERGEGAAALAARQRAADLMPLDAGAERAQILGGQARLLSAAGHYADARAKAQEALDVARAAGARREEGDALNSLGVVLGRLGRPEEGAALLEESIRIAESVGSLEDMRRGYNNLLATLHDGLGQPARAAEVALAGAARLESLNYETGALYLRAAAAHSLMASGSFDDAAAIATSVLTGLERAPNVFAGWIARLAVGVSAVRRGDLDSGRHHLEQAHALWSDSTNPDYLAMVGAARAELALTEGRVDDTYATVVQILDAIGHSDGGHYVRLLASLGLRALGDRGRRAARDDTATRTRADALLDRVRAAEGAASGPATVPDHALQALCEAEWTRTSRTPHPARWSAVASAWAEAYPYEAAYATFREAEAHLAGGDKADAVRCLRSAYAEATRLGAGPLVGDIEALARRARVRLSPAAAEATAPGTSSPLTARETEVLAAVAAGDTNRDIARALFMSEKTASVHVSRILTKLGVTNRGQAAAAAYRLGLLDRERAPDR